MGRRQALDAYRPSALRGALTLLAPWRRTLALVAALVLAAAALELVPPLILRSAIDDHLSKPAQGATPALATKESP